MRARLVALVGLLAAASLAGGCTSDPQELSVDLRTDFVPVEEFIGVRTTVFGYEGGMRSARVDSSDHTPALTASYRDGVRVAELRDVGNRRFEVEVSLVGRDGRDLATRNVIVTVSGSYALTVLVTRDCRARECPAAGDPAYATACIAGRCGDPRCGGEGAMSCPPPECSFDADCPAPAATCARARCLEGACLAITATPCGAGLWCNPEVGCEPSMGQPDAGTLDAGGGSDAGAPPDAGGVVPSLTFAPRPVGAGNPGFPAVITAAAGGFLVAYGRSGGGLAVAHTNGAGDPLSTDTLFATGTQEPLSMAVGPRGRVALTWSESNTSHIAFVETGVPVDDRVLTTTTSVVDRALVSSGADGFEVLWHENDGRIRAQHIAADGSQAPILEVEPVADAEVHAIASGVSGYLLVYGTLDERHVRLLGPVDGTPASPVRLLPRLDPSGGAGWNGSAVARGTGFVVVLTDLRPGAGLAGVAYRLSSDATPGAALPIGPTGAPASGPWTAENAASGEALALWWNHGDPQLQRFDATGLPIGVPSTFAAPIGFTGLAWRPTGTGVLVQSGGFVQVALLTGWPP